MATVFTLIMNREIPGRFIWTDDVCAAFLTIEPLQPGHTLVVPRAEVDKWTDLPGDVWQHVMGVAHTIGAAQQAAFNPRRIGVLVQGYEVPHAHVHVWPSQSSADFDLASAARNVPGGELDTAAETLRHTLRNHGHAAHLPG